MKKNYWLWLIALLVVNTGWYFVSEQSATQEINRPGADFEENRDAELSAVVGDKLDYEIEHCFESLNGRVLSVNLSIEQGSDTIYSWSGTTDDGCVVYSATAEEGKITVVTTVEEGVESKTVVTTWPLKGAFIGGVVLFSIGTIAVAFGETFVRYTIKQRMDKNSTTVQEETPTTTVTSGIWQDPLRPN